MKEQCEPLENLEFDKIPGFWILTYWMCPTVALRLKIRHSGWDEPHEMIAEARVALDREFTPVGKPFWTFAWGLLHPEECQEQDDFPSPFKREFTMMALRWAALSELLELAGTLGNLQRYEFEPGSSVDCFLAAATEQGGLACKPPALTASDFDCSPAIWLDALRTTHPPTQLGKVDVGTIANDDKGAHCSGAAIR